MTITVLLTLLSIVVGLIFGSFLTVCIYRIPYGRYNPIDTKTGEELPMPEQVQGKHLSIFTPSRSFCPACKKQLPWYWNIPLFSWLGLGGKCGACKVAIPARYPAIELLTALTTLLTFLIYGPTPVGFLIFAFGCALIVISFIDIDYMIIPDVISLPGCILGVAVAGFQAAVQVNNEPFFDYPVVGGPFESMLGFLAGAGVLYVVAIGYLKLRGRDGMGFGDIKLLALIGIWFGPECTVFTLMLSSILAVLFTLPFVLFRSRGYNQYLPFGPYIAAAAFLWLVDINAVWNAVAYGKIPLHWWINSAPS